MPASHLDRRLHRFLIWAVLLLTAGYTFLDYWEYSRIQHADPLSWTLLATGRGLAPAQYRIGVYSTANFLAHLTLLQFRHIFAIRDCLVTGLSLACIFYLLTRQRVFREASLPAQWAQAMLAMLLAQLYLAWTLWFQQPETMPSLAILAASSFLYWCILCENPPVPRPMLAISLLLVAILGATIRVDAITAFQAGIFIASLQPRRSLKHSSIQGAVWLTWTSLPAIIATVSVGYFIQHRLFPQAIRSAPLLQLRDNLHSLNGIVAILCTLPAWALTLWLIAKTWSSQSLWTRGLAIGSVFHFLMFFTFGMSEEVRIFLPFTLTLVPLSATLLYPWLCQPQDHS